MNVDADRPLASVVIPTHYRNERLREAVESALDQTHEPVEVVVVDDSGERHAAPVAEEYDVDYVGFDRNRGSNEARMVGFGRSRGEYVQFLDDDDRLHPEKIERQITLLESRPEVGVAYCGMRFEDGRVVSPSPGCRGDVLARALAFDLYPCLTTTMLTRREAMATALPLRALPGGDDLAWMIDLARETAFDFVDEPLVTRGVEPDSRGKSLGVYEGRRRIVEEYDDLYEAFPPPVRRRALASTHEFRGQALLSRRAWSPTAVLSFARAFRYRPSAYAAGLAAASVFGRPGVEVGSAVLRRFNE